MNKPTKQGWADDVVGYYRELNPGTPVPESLRKQADLLHGVFRGAKATARFLCGVSGGSACLNPLPLKSPLLKGKRAQNITAVIDTSGVVQARYASTIEGLYAGS